MKHLFSESQTTPTLASARIQHWSLTLGAYDYTIVYKPRQEHGNAHMLSRLSLPETPAKVPVLGETILLLDMLNSLPVTSEHIRQWTSMDPVLSKVKLMVQQGWQDSKEANLIPYQRLKDELTIHDGCLLWETKVVVQPSGCLKITHELHEGHPGITCMRALARSFVW